MMAALQSRRGFLALLAGAPVAGRAGASASLPVAASLGLALAQALAAGQPLLVLVSLEGCPFCQMARENYLLPLHQRQGLPVVQVDMRSKQLLSNFQGATQTHDDWIRAMGVTVAPTLLFFGRNGTEIVERMRGSYLADFYGAYLDDRLRQAQALLRT